MSDEATGLATTALPDHPIRNATWYQLFCRLWRPTLGWVGVLSGIYIFAVGPAIQRPVDPVVVAHWLVLVLAIYGIRSIEKLRGVA